MYNQIKKEIWRFCINLRFVEYEIVVVNIRLKGQRFTNSIELLLPFTTIQGTGIHLISNSGPCVSP